MVRYYKIYINAVEESLAIISFSIKNNIKTYIPIASIKLINPNGVYNDKFSINDTIRIDLYDKDTTAYVEKVFVGYVSKKQQSDKDSTLDVECNGLGGRMFERIVSTAYKHWEVSRIASDIATNHLSEFTQTNINNTGTETVMNTQDTTDGTVSLTVVDEKYAQKFQPTQTNLIKVDIYINASASGIADVQLRSNNAGEPSTYDLLQQVSNVTLTAGWNTVYLTRKNLDTALFYWIVIIWKSGTFSIDKNLAGSSGRVYKSTTDPEVWVIQTEDDLRFRTYSTSGVILDLAKFSALNVNECYKILIDALPDSWIYYIDNDSDIHFEIESFAVSAFSSTDANTFNVETAKESKKIYNDITIYGGERLTENFNDEFKGDGLTTTFIFSPGNPESPVKQVTVNTVIKIEDTDFTVDYDKKSITFSVAPGNGVTISIIHDYRLKIIANAKDDESIDKYGLREYTKRDDNIISNERAEEIADALLKLYKDEYNNIKTHHFLNPTINLAEYMTTTNTRLDLNDSYLITQIEHKHSNQGLETITSLAAEDLAEIPDVLRELKSQIKVVEMSQVNLDDPVTRIIKLPTKIKLTATNALFHRNLCDSFILGHPTDNGRLGWGELLDDFETNVVANWTSTDGVVSVSADPTFFWVGVQCMKFTPNASGESIINSVQAFGSVQTQTGIASGTPVQGTNGLWIYLTNSTDLNDLTLEIGNDSSNYYRYVGTTKTIAGTFYAGRNYVVFDLDGAHSEIGTVDWTNIDYVNIKINTNNTNPVYFDYFDINQSNSIGLNGLGFRYLDVVI